MQDQFTENFDLLDNLSLQPVLSDALACAKADACSKIVTISTPLSYVAPLALLESLNLKGHFHFYVERPTEDLSLLAYGAICSEQFQGKDRFNSAKQFSEQCLSRIFECKAEDEGFSGPHFFTAFTFSDEVTDIGSFVPATIFLPEWHIYSYSGLYGMVLNVSVDPDSNIEDLLRVVAQKLDYFRNLDYAEDSNNKTATHSIDLNHCIKRSDFESSVEGALSDIHQGRYQKIVLSQKITYEKSPEISGVDFLNRLRERFTSCYTFSFSDGSEKSFIGASPEKLVQIKNQVVSTEAIAGSSSRGKKPTEDARLGVDLLQSDKNLREHNLVINSIIKRLSILAIEAESDSKPRLLALANVQHLMTKIKGLLPQDTHILDVVSELHPTPAVGGQPREQAVPRIQELEQFNRGLYAGLIGWFNQDNDGEMIVAIRSAQFNSESVDVFAGAGIVHGSELEKEKNEIQLKFAAILQALLNA